VAFYHYNIYLMFYQHGILWRDGQIHILQLVRIAYPQECRKNDQREIETKRGSRWKREIGGERKRPIQEMKDRAGESKWRERLRTVGLILLTSLDTQR
jgi:hypothetical protein